MKNLLVILTLLTTGCSSEAQSDNSDANTKSQESIAVVEGGILISIEGIDVSKYQLDVEDFDVEDIRKNHLLCLATDECDEELIVELIDKGVDVNFRCEEINHVITNLAFCKENGVKLAELLLNKGADINGTDQDNDSFLSYAISYDNLKLAEYLIEKGANRIQRDTNRNMGCLPIHGVESVEMLELLIAKKFEIDQLCDNGRNLLHFAVKDNLKELAQYLIDKNLVDINQKDKNGETPLDYSARFNHPDVAEIIRNKN